MTTARSIGPTDEVVVDEYDDRAVLLLNRPGKRDAVNLAIDEALHDVCAFLERSPRVLLIGGVGATFAAGADVGELARRSHRGALNGCVNPSVFARVRSLPMPTIALADGYVLGTGAELAYACDFRLGTTRTRIGNPEVSLGNAAAAGTMWRLRELVGELLAKEMLLAGRMLTPIEAASAGLLNKVVEPEDLLAEGHHLADRIALGSPDAVRRTKLVLDSHPGAYPALDDAAQAVRSGPTEQAGRMPGFLERGRSGG
ncbi:enoyl-CoA hydratase/isomerase family protein [Streptomyces sp. NPDC005728]|uniref:enoyl-CoA hydratase/isomerase family protein n=1 Tax=Streptomyces sp. NPDC005728 TaxID=3157054 RepID=UPI0033D806AC